MNILLGAHVSIAGGLVNACLHAKNTGSNVIQIFTKNQVQWSAKPLNLNDIHFFKECMVRENIMVVAHLSYLVNLGSTDETIREKSVNAVINEIKRCGLLGIKSLIFHPGSNKSLTPDETIRQIALNLSDIIRQTEKFEDVCLVIETTAGQGSQIGYKSEHIARIIKLLGDNKRVGVCIDTCHIFAAGYDIRTLPKYNKYMDDFDKIVGLDRLRALHINDSIKPLSSSVDRHALIGKGYIGQDTFGFIVNDKRLIRIPLIIETPGGDKEHKADIDILKSMVRKCSH